MWNERKEITDIGKIRYQIAKESTVNLDELNLLAFQELPYLCKCDYERNPDGKRFFLFKASNENSIKNTLAYADKLFVKKYFLQFTNYLI